MRPIAETVYGKLEGQERGGVTSFLGVPFAAPPFGPNRFRPPARPARWDGTRPAHEKGPIAPQAAGGPLALDSGAPGEDCLNLNIWTPDLGGSGLPVMVFAHGGGQVAGTGSDPTYDGTRLASEGVVVVTTNRRLGAEGFLYLGELHDDERGTGNFGLLDVIESLRWVQENIAAFGGDPGNVTLFGESGGGAATTAVMSMPASRGLFHRAIPQSAGDNVNDTETAAAAARRVLELIGVTPGDWDALAATPWQKFIEVFPKVMPPGAPGAPVYCPTAGGILPARPSDAIAAGAGADVSLLIGTNRDEETLFETLAPMLGKGLQNRMLPELGQRLEKAGVKLDDALHAYGRAHPEWSRDQLATALIGDSRFRFSSLKIADGHARHSQAGTFMYLFAWAVPKVGATHALDLLPVFGNYENNFFAKMAGDLPHEKLDRTMRAAWVAFASTGDPGTPELQWPCYETAMRRTMQLDETCRVLEDPFAEQRAVLSGLV